jgi:hypothetical protein
MGIASREAIAQAFRPPESKAAAIRAAAAGRKLIAYKMIGPGGSC